MKLYRFKLVVIIWKNTQKMQLNQRIFHNQQSHLACWYFKMCTLIRHTIYKSLVKILYFRHEYSSIMYENTQNRKIIKEPSITCRYIWHVNISKCTYLLDIHSVKVWWSYVLPNSNAVEIFNVFFRHIQT